MELLNYFNIYYLLSFMGISYFVLKNASIPVAKAWTVLIVGVVVGFPFFVFSDTGWEGLLATFAIGTSFYELVIKYILKKFGL
jgi:hypothetical protein